MKLTRHSSLVTRHSSLAYCVRAIHPQHGYGGLERSASALMRQLLALGVDLTLFTRPLPPGQPIFTSEGAVGRLTVRTARYSGLPLPPNGIPARLTNYRAFVEDMGRRVRAMSYKGYVHGIYAHGLCAWGMRQAGEWGVPLVANPHGMEEFKVRHPLKRLAYAPFRAWVRAGCRAADRVIATDYAMRAEVATLLRIDPGKVAVVPNGVDLDEARSFISEDVQYALAARWPYLASNGDGLRGISVGRLEANKGFEYLLDALSQVKEDLGAGWGWTLVGEGSLRESLEKRAANLGLLDHLHFVGRVSDPELHNLYAMSNIFVHPTLYEGSSLVTLEAMAHGLPVVASAVGGIPDKLVEGETGFLARPGDAATLARRLAWMTAHPQERALMGVRGAEKATQFGWDHIAARTLELFAEIREERAGSTPHSALHTPHSGGEVASGLC